MTMRALFGAMAATAALTTVAAAQTYNPSLSDEQIVEKYCAGSPKVRLFVKEALSPTIVFCGRELIIRMAPATACASIQFGIASFDREAAHEKNPAWPDMTLGDLYVENVWANARYCQKKDKTSFNFGPYALGNHIG